MTRRIQKHTKAQEFENVGDNKFSGSQRNLLTQPALLTALATELPPSTTEIQPSQNNTVNTNDYFGKESKF